ncbi:MAG: hypothetical protein A3J54_00420 [Candidatus Ryanbacteria bacterium RIFCSPHIGHO2_02_FULL_45_13b]|uniref:Uncharacterized protein n=1 Tax=Candidatus Ryanbacteria bacterium RIFCSPHIGHO2_02_FULL_45_13b TaxID=1802117 RepID=A0A1G2G3P2_9BACT|nr:MAG: hypothetical protein A3J54_00420 [Candidatus Ryanbacteria bacterium RIFCSPHIGHO2_02_FULL_45_13b]
MKHFNSGFLYFVVIIVLLLALSAPALPSTASTHATLLESIQQQLNEIIAAVARIQVRILELIAEEAQSPRQDIDNKLPEIPATSTSTEAVWKFVPIPSLYLSQPLTILYRFSITGGTTDTIIPSVAYTVAFGDISIKNLEVYAYSDELFSVPAFLRNTVTKENRVGKQTGFLDSSSGLVSVLFDQGPPQVKIPAGETYYFELRGTVVAKNKNAFLTIAAEGLSEIRLE